MSATDSGKDNTPPREEWEDVVRQSVKKMTFGIVQIVVHEGRVTQVEATEKTRLAGKGDLSG